MSMYEDEITDIYDFAVPLQKSHTKYKNKNIKKNLKRIQNKNIHKLDTKDLRFVIRNKNKTISNSINNNDTRV